MADDKFDSIVVGAGPAGVSAAITMARAGLNVALLERGEYAGAKNVQGAILYSKMFADVVIACDGANSILGQKAGLLKREWRSDEIALGVKEILALPRQTIED